MLSTISLAGFISFLSSAVFVVGYIQSSNLFPEPLSPSEELYYLDKFKSGDNNARNILIEKNLRLVAHVAKKYSTSNIEQDDLISIGTIGLIKGINSFKHDKGVKLSTYIAKCIDNEILMFLRSSKKIQSEVNLSDPIGKDKDDNVVTLQEVLEADIKSIEDEVDLDLKREQLYNNIGKVLKDREKDIIIRRFGLNGRKPETQNEIAKDLKISRSYVSRIETKAIKKLEAKFKDCT